MLRRDFIMVQIEELSKVVLQLIGLRNANAARKIPELVQTVYSSLRVTSSYLMTTNSDDIRHYLDNDDGGGLQRMEIAVKTLIEESYLYPDQQQSMLIRAKELLVYLQNQDTTFSLERIAMIDEINKMLLQG